MIYYIASSMNSDFIDWEFLGKMQKRICKLPKRFANCELRAANSNPDTPENIRKSRILLFSGGI